MLNEILISIAIALFIIVIIILIYNRGENMGFLRRGRPKKEEAPVIEDAPAMKSKTVQSGKEIEDMNTDAAKQRKIADLEYFKDIYLGSYTADEFVQEGSFEAEICTLVYGLVQELKNQNYMLQQIMVSMQK